MQSEFPPLPALGGDASTASFQRHLSYPNPLPPAPHLGTKVRPGAGVLAHTRPRRNGHGLPSSGACHRLCLCGRTPLVTAETLRDSCRRTGAAPSAPSGTADPCGSHPGHVPSQDAGWTPRAVDRGGHFEPESQRANRPLAVCLRTTGPSCLQDAFRAPEPQPLCLLDRTIFLSCSPAPQLAVTHVCSPGQWPHLSPSSYVLSRNLKTQTGRRQLLSSDVRCVRLPNRRVRPAAQDGS